MPLFPLALLSLVLLPALRVFLLFAAEEVLPCFHLQVLFAGLLRRGERGVLVLLLALLGELLALNALLLEMGKEAVPVLVSDLWIFSELSLDHELLNVVDGVDVAHCVLHHPSHYLQILEVPHCGDSMALH